LSNKAATEESSPPLSATATFFLDIDLAGKVILIILHLSVDPLP
jgi:hypothetical protein